MPNHNKLFCSKPFKWFEVTGFKNPKGDVYMCCPGWLSTPIGNLQNQSVEEIWNGKKAQKIRRSILDGTFDYCNRKTCPFLQTVSGPVQKVPDVEEEDLKEIIAKDLVVLPHGPREINCSYDRSCNLSCPSCRVEVIIETQHEQQILNIQEKLNKEAFKDAWLIYITGSGDPFGSPYFSRLLRSMKIAEMPNLPKVRLHTNALLWTPRIWCQIPKEVRTLIRSAEISIDAATSETYAFNRRGGDFDRLLQNLEFISSLRREGPLEEVTISMVVQENNFREMPEFVRIGQRFQFDIVYFSQLVNWGTFSKDEFQLRAIHLPDHPRHQELAGVLTEDILKDPIVYLGNLTDVETLRIS